VLLAAASVLGGCGSEEDGAEEAPPPRVALRDFPSALRELPCPTPDLRLRAEQRFSRAAVSAAREENRFAVHETELRLEPPVDWLQDPYDSKGFRARLADLDWTAVLFHAYREGDRAALEQAGELILDWVREQPRGGKRTSEEAWQDKVTGDRVLTLAYLARAGACQNTLTDRELGQLGESIAEHVELLTDPEVYVPTNHGLYMDLSLVLLSRQLSSVEAAAQWRELALGRFEDTFASRVVEDEGLWLEHSAGYQLLLTNLLAKALETPGFESPELETVLERMRETSGWLVMPDEQIPQFGHTDEAGAPAYARRLARDDRGIHALLESGLAVVKAPGAYLSVLASFHSTAHKQADELTFDLYDRGLGIVSDTGLYHKDRDEYYEFASSPAAHSTLTVDGQGFGIEDDNAYGGGLLATGEGDGWYAILGENPLLRKQGVEHTRLFLYRPGEELIVADRVRSGQEHTYRRHFQLGPEVEVTEGPDGLALSAPGFEGSLNGGGEAELSRGEADPLRGYVFPGFREQVPRWTATFESRAVDAEYAAAFDLDGAGLRARVLSFEPEEIELEAGGEPITVTREGERLVVEGR
jgi:hypothetical protein